MSRLQTNAIRHLGSVVDNLVLDNAGRVLKPNNPAFNAYSNGAGYTVTAYATFPWDTVDQAGNGFDTGTGRFTAQVAGMYLFSVNVYHNSSTSYRLNISKNGASPYNALIAQHQYVTSNDETMNVTTILRLAVGDYVDVREAAGQSLAYWRAHSNFVGFLIG